MMTTVGKLTLDGRSGASYDFEIYKKEEYMEDIACVYIFTYKKEKLWVPVYIGQTNELARRISEHRNRDVISGRCIQSSGATHVFVHREISKSRRLEIEEDIRKSYDWRCNEK